MVRWRREGTHGGGERRHQEVRRLLAEGFKLRDVGGAEGAVVLWLRKGAQGGRGPQQNDKNKCEDCTLK
jgi:hypothetical protein